MATRTIARLFDSYNNASAAVSDLEAAGFARDDISLIANRTGSAGTSSYDAGGDAADERVGETGAGTGTGATLGTVLGGGAGLLAGLGALAIPGIGPVVAAGWLIATLTGAGVGAAAGGLLGALTQSGVGEENAHVYAEGVRRGGNLVTLRTDESRVAEAEGIMARHNAVDTTARSGEWRNSGWTGAYDESAGPYTGGPTATGAAGTTAGSVGNAMGVGQPDGTPGNPPGTAASRAVDRNLGTNISGAHPENERR